MWSAGDVDSLLIEMGHPCVQNDNNQSNYLPVKTENKCVNVHVHVIIIIIIIIMINS